MRTPERERAADATGPPVMARRHLHIGIDDTDTPDSAGTNQLARRLAAAVPTGYEVLLVLRHQLLLDPRVPFTSHNGSASLLVQCDNEHGSTADLIPHLRAGMLDAYIPGSDPGLCVAAEVGDDVAAFGQRCQRAIVRQDEARALAREHDIHLEGLGGPEDGVIGALAAVGLLSSGNDGRVVHMRGWTWPDPFAGTRSVRSIIARGVDEVCVHETGEPVPDGVVDVGKHLRPAYREHRVILHVTASESGRWQALKLP